MLPICKFAVCIAQNQAENCPLCFVYILEEEKTQSGRQKIVQVSKRRTGSLFVCLLGCVILKFRMGVGTEGTRDNNESREDGKAGLAY